jgi:hypothetical protein
VNRKATSERRDGTRVVPFSCGRCKRKLGKFVANPNRLVEIEIESNHGTAVTDSLGARVNMAVALSKTARITISCPKCRASYTITDKAIWDTLDRNQWQKVNLAEIHRNPVSKSSLLPPPDIGNQDPQSNVSSKEGNR